MKSAQYFFTTILCFLAARQASAQAVTPGANVPVPVSSYSPLTVFPSLSDYSSTSIRNYVRTYTPKEAISDPALVILGDYGSASRANTVYYDGLGRPVQEIDFGAISGSYDMVKLHTYDAQGRETYKYLPYSVNYQNAPANWYIGKGKLKVNPATQLTALYNNLYPGQAPYTRSVYEASALNKVIREEQAGVNFTGSNRGASVALAVNTNGNADKIIRFTIGYGTSLTTPILPVNNNYYGYGELMGTVKTDEDGHQVTEYKNKQGQLVASMQKVDYTGSITPATWYKEYQITYNIYDDMGRLRFVISPEAYIRAMNDAGGSITTAIANGLCYQYLYDDKGRLIEKRLPGKEPEYIMYDFRDLPVLSQDGNLRQKHQWQFSLYDGQKRTIATGLFTQTRGSFSSREASVAAFLPPVPAANSIPNLVRESEPASIDNLPVVPASFADGTAMMYHYYDKAPAGAPAFTTAYNGMLTGASPMPTASTLTRGLLLHSDIAIINPGTTTISGPLRRDFIYDQQGRLVQSHSLNHKNSTSIQTNQYDFLGQVESSALHHVNDAAVGTSANPLIDKNVDLVKTYPKDANANITGLRIDLNNTGATEVSVSIPDLLNRTAQKNVGSFPVEYGYNINNRLTGINERWVDKKTATAMPEQVFFAESIAYDDGFASKLYNGSIAGIRWRNTGIGTTTRAYGYTYDQRNQLQHAEFNELLNTGSWLWQKWSTDFTTSNLSYDHNGNISSMNQRGPGLGGATDMDLLQYSYGANSNKLTSVQDNATAATLAPDFKDGNTGSDDYAYDAAGNLAKDLNKDIRQITYNYLNKPELVTFGKGTVQYIYAADGSRLQKIMQSYGPARVIDYINGFEYQDNKLQTLQHEEGRCRPVTDALASGGRRAFTYDYYFKDHLDNVRTVINAREQDPLTYLASYELNQAATEGLVFGGLDPVREDKPLAGSPTDEKAGHLDPGDPNKRISASLMQRVMPGDAFDLDADYYYSSFVPGSSQPIDGNEMLNSILGTLAGGGGLIGGAENMGGAALAGQLFNPANYLSAYQSQVNAVTDPGKPAAYLNYLVFDDNMQLVPEQSGAIQVGYGQQWQNIGTSAPLTIGQAGYLVTYVSVGAYVPGGIFFDRVRLRMYRGKVLEENHYYPFGLTLSAEPVAAGELNNYKYNSKEWQRNELNDDGGKAGLEWYDFDARMQDPQLGRMNSMDGSAEKYTDCSPYSYTFNNPVSFTDPSGNDPKMSGLWSNELSQVFRQRMMDVADVGLSYYNQEEYGDGEGLGGYRQRSMPLSPFSGDAELNYSFADKNASLNSIGSSNESIYSDVRNFGLTFTIYGAPIIDKYTARLFTRSFKAAGATEYTSLASIFFRKETPAFLKTVKFLPKSISLGGQLGRAVPYVGWGITFGENIYENIAYQRKISNNTQTFEQVQDHYNNIMISPAFWIYKKFEPFLIELGK